MYKSLFSINISINLYVCLSQDIPVSKSFYAYILCNIQKIFLTHYYLMIYLNLCKSLFVFYVHYYPW